MERERRSRYNKRNRQQVSTQNPYYIIQLSGVSKAITLQDVLVSLSNEIKSIIGIARTADYRAKELGETIYAISVSKADAARMHNRVIVINNDCSFARVVDVVFGRAKLPQRNGCEVPRSLFIKQLSKQPAQIAIDYLAEIVKTFESYETITAVRLGYDAVHDKTLGFGFVTFFRSQIAMRIGDAEHTVGDKTISSLLSDNVPLLLKAKYSSLLINGEAKWTTEAAKRNILMIHSPDSRLVPSRSDDQTERNEDAHSTEVDQQVKRIRIDENDMDILIINNDDDLE